MRPSSSAPLKEEMEDHCQPSQVAQAASLPKASQKNSPPGSHPSHPSHPETSTGQHAVSPGLGQESSWMKWCPPVNRQSVNHMLQELSQMLYGSGLYRLTLAGSTPSVMLPMVEDPWPGDFHQGRDILEGRFCFAGETVERAANLWRPRTASQEWLQIMHSFAWLRDLRAVEQPEAVRLARALVAAWIDAHPNWTATAWAPDVLGLRLAHWIGHARFLLNDDQSFQSLFFASLSRQAKHLSRCLPAGLKGIQLVRAIKGLIMANLALPEGEDRLARSLKMLGLAVETQILPDGGHVERNPSVQLEMLQHLLDIRSLLNARKIELPEWIQPALDRMTPMLRFFCHGDGGLALFNGSREEGIDKVGLVLKRADMRGRAPLQAPHSGFHRLQLGRSLILIDTGSPPPSGLDARAHAGTLGFEFSYGRERVITNCGAQIGGGPVWHALQKSTAAHSTLTVDDTNSSEILSDGGIGRRPGMVVCHRDQGDGRIWLEANHDGYRRTHGLVHRRRLYFAENGDDLRGEDWLIGRPGPHFSLRFHLHPLVRTSIIREGQAALLRLPSGVGWRLRTGDAHITVSESVYLGDGTVRKSQQLVISGHMTEKETRLRWALQREG